MLKTEADLVTNKSNIRYLSNFTGSSGFMLITKSKKHLFTDFRYLERAKDTIKEGIEIVDTTRMFRNPKELKQNWQKILKQNKIEHLGIEETDLTVSRYKFFKKISRPLKFKDISGKYETLREIKGEEEVKLITKSQRINEKVFIEIKKIVQDFVSGRSKENHLTEINLAWKIKELGHQFGAEDVSFDPIVAFGAHSARPHHEPDNTKLKKGDLILVDMGMKYHGYCSDMTRMIFTQKPTKEQAEIYNLVLKAQENALKNLKAGISGKDADKLSRDLIVEAGYGDYYGHAGGHGIGLDIHESPSLSEKYVKTIRKNTIVTVEPGIYLPGKFGVRIEDMALIKEEGIENLTKISKKI